MSWKCNCNLRSTSTLNVINSSESKQGADCYKRACGWWKKTSNRCTAPNLHFTSAAELSFSYNWEQGIRAPKVLPWIYVKHRYALGFLI